MLSMSHDEALIVVLDEAPISAVETAATEHGWMVLNNPEPTGLACEFKLRKPHVVVIQVARKLLLVKRAGRFVRWMRQQGGATGILAVASEHDPQLEGELREAGITGYLTPDVKSGEISHAVRALLSISGVGDGSGQMAPKKMKKPGSGRSRATQQDTSSPL